MNVDGRKGEECNERERVHYLYGVGKCMQLEHLNWTITVPKLKKRKDLANGKI